MDLQRQIEKIGNFDKWIPLGRFCAGDLPRYEAIPCVYAMRSTATGKILYIGSTKSLSHRIFANYIGGFGGETTQRLHELLFTQGKIAEVELAWIESDTWEDKESELKKEYQKKYEGLPDWNRR